MSVVTDAWRNVSLKEPLGLLTLLGLPGVGGRTVKLLADRLDVLGAVHESGSLPAGVSSAAARNLRDVDAVIAAHARAVAIVAKAEETGTRLVGVYDESYPQLLASIADPPPVLFVKGSLRDDATKCVAVVGTRKPSEWGCEQTRSFVREVASKGWTVVSGLALGVDQEAHEVAVATGAPTVAVLGGGLDRVSPAQNRALAESILESGGALVSEQPFGVSASKATLVQRNRVTSGLSAATVLVESALTGGSMQTVRFAVLQGRQVFAAVPDEPNHPSTDALTRLTTLSGPELAAVVKATGEYERRLREEFRISPVALPLRAFASRGA
ncbi:DNA-processing protein DprA [Candidatus Binatia bacterium]|nr:DNA-processing protein DprA [Candidatus Binatia bacterium]